MRPWRKNSRVKKGSESVFNLNLRILQAGLIAGALGVGIILVGCGGEEPAPVVAPTPSTGPTMGGMPGGGMGGQTMPGMGQPMGGQAMPGMGGAAGMAGAPGGAPTQVASNQAPPKHRPDPFRPWWDSRPPRPSVISFVPPIRIAANLNIPPPRAGVEVREVPQGRVAGILSGNGVYALIESPDAPQGQAVIRPGDMIGEYRVASINQDSVTLKRTVRVGDRTETYTQIVPLTDIGSMQQQFSGPPAGGPGGAGMFPGGGPGLPGRRGGGPGQSVDE